MISTLEMTSQKSGVCLPGESKSRQINYENEPSYYDVQCSPTQKHYQTYNVNSPEDKKPGREV